MPDLARWGGRTPILVDDIISTARTMIAAVEQLRAEGTPPAVCVGSHAVTCDRAEEDLRAAGAARIVTCKTIPHATNAIDVRPLFAATVRPFLAD
jgi:ribose-phosphate pyrophosphokinase